LSAPRTSCLFGCGRYADFRLPTVSGGDPDMTFAFEAQAEPVLTAETAGIARRPQPSVISRPWPRPADPAGTPPGSWPCILYSGFDGHTWRNGPRHVWRRTHWQKQGVILSPDARTWEGSYIAANGSALWYENQFWYWYQAGSRERPASAWPARWIRTPGAKSQGPCLNRVRTEAGTSRRGRS